MRTAIVFVWLLVLVAVGAYHAGPGQDMLLLDDVSRLLRQADTHVAAEQWGLAVEDYDAALNLLPAKHVKQSRQVRLQRAKAKTLASKLPEAHDELMALVAELKTDDHADPQMLAEAQSAFANTKYYLTWLMRLEGHGREVWEPEIETARQTYRLLAEQAQAQGDTSKLERHREDLESTILLARLDLGDLQGLPLPSQ